MNPLDYLILAPHPDDAEIGVGGTMALLLSQGARVGVLELTDGEPTPYGSPEIRARETEAATAALHLTWRGNLGFPNRKLESTIENRARLAAAFRELRPRVLFAPYWEDAHPDHVAATRLIEDARFWAKLTKSDLPGEPHHPAKILYYFSVHLRVHPQPAFVVDITAHIETKMKALACYHSQLVQNRTTWPTPLDDLRDRARYWGWAIGAGYGEPFASREPVGLRGLGDLS